VNSSHRNLEGPSRNAAVQYDLKGSQSALSNCPEGSVHQEGVTDLVIKVACKTDKRGGRVRVAQLHLRHSTFTPVGQLRLPCALRPSPIGKMAFGSLELTSICIIDVQVGGTELRLQDPRNAEGILSERYSFTLFLKGILPPHSRLKACSLLTKLLPSTARKRQGLLAISTCHIRFIVVWLGTLLRGVCLPRRDKNPSLGTRPSPHFCGSSPVPYRFWPIGLGADVTNLTPSHAYEYDEVRSSPKGRAMA
jgi:hypothetical protein